ncbi:hypothetical protein ACXYMU_13400 [Pontibacter sp. CAU 1760]
MMSKITKVYILVISGILMACSNISTKTKEEKFWDWFSKNEQTYYQLEQNQETEFDRLSQELKQIDENLVFEFSPIHEDGTKEFTISAEGIVESFPIVTKLVGIAPKIEKWKINAFRQRIPGDDIVIKLGDSLKLGYEDIYFRYGYDKGKIGLELNIRNYKDEPQLNQAIYILLDGLIGEYDMETKISWIERKNLIESEADSLYKIVELRQIVDKEMPK